MRFIVELYRMLILTMLALAIVATSYLIFEVLQAPQLPTGVGALTMIAALALAAFVILSLGITATFISMHDRLEELANAADDLRRNARGLLDQAGKEPTVE